MLLAATSGATAAPAAPARQSVTELLAGSSAADWRPLDPNNTLYLELASGRVVIELAPRFAPLHVAIVRVQDNYVVQWADPDGRRPVPPTVRKVAAEFDSPVPADMPFTALPDGDVYAPRVGFSDGFPVALDARHDRTWLVHCYGMVGAGRDDDEESSGTELYAVIGHAPRHLDRNVAMGFYAKNETPVPIRALELAADVPPAQRSDLEVLRTDSKLFKDVVEARRNRPEQWFKTKAGRIDVCNVPIPVRPRPAAPAAASTQPAP